MIAKISTNYVIDAISAALRAGEAILDVYQSEFEVELKQDRSPLTLADRQSHEIIYAAMEKTGYPILSEEGKDIPYEERISWENFWLVDPLDGTKEFIKRNGEFTVNIALIHKTSPVMGVVYVPVKDVLYFASEGLGAYKLENARDALHVRSATGTDTPSPPSSPSRGEDRPSSTLPSTAPDLSGIAKAFSDNAPPLRGGDEGEGEICGLNLNTILKKSTKLPLPEKPNRPYTVVASRSHLNKDTEDYLAKLKAEHGEIDLISAGSSLKFCLVAEGLADEYPRFGPTMEWDTAAGQAVVEASGGKARSSIREPLNYNKENLMNPFFSVTGKI